MPYIFLNTVADVTNFYVPTPIILSGDYLNGQDNIKTKCDKVISNDNGCSAYLLSVGLVELLEVLEREGFQTISVNRNGNHNVWILHKENNFDNQRGIRNIKKHTVRFNKRNYHIDENSSSSSIEKIDKFNLSQFYKPLMKSEKSQTPTNISLFGGGDFSNLFGVQCQCRDKQFEVINHSITTEDVLAMGEPLKLQNDFQNQTSFNNITETVNFGCQCSSKHFELKIDSSYHDLSESEQQSVIIKSTDEDKCSHTVNPFEVNPVTTVPKDKFGTKMDKTFDDFVNVKSETTLETNRIDSHSSNSIFDNIDKTDFFNFGKESIAGSSKENLNHKTHDILLKLEKRFQNEHEYFSNVRIKRSKNDRSTKHSINDRYKKADSNCGTVHLKDDGVNNINFSYKYKSASDNQSYKKLSSNNSILKNASKYDSANDNLNMLLSNRVKSTESVNFYEALDNSSAISLHESFKNDINEKRYPDGNENDNDGIEFKDKSKNMLSKRLNSTEKSNNIKRSIYDKKVNTFLRNRCSVDGSNKLKSHEISQDENNIDHNNNLNHAGCFGNRGSEEGSKIFLNYSVTVDNEENSSLDYITAEKKHDLFKKRLLLASSKQQCNFKNRFNQRAERMTINQKQINFFANFRQRNNLGLSKEPVKSSKDIRDFRAATLNRSTTPTLSNKEKVPPGSSGKHLNFQRKFKEFKH